MSPIDPFDRHPASGATDCDGAAPARRWPRPLAGALTLLLALSLAACGGGGSNAADPLESATPYGAADAASPAGARDLPVDELRALVAGGTPVTWLQAGASDAAIAADQAAQAADEATLAASTDPQIAALRARTLGVGDDMTLLPSGDRRFAIESPLGRESVVVHGDAWRRRELATSAAALASRDNAIALYRQFRDPLPEGVLADLPPVDALGTLSDAEVQALVDRAAQRAVDVLSNESALPEEGAASSANGSRRLVQGRQQRLLAPSTSGCTHADEFSLYGEFDFALKNALSGVRSQGSRGTCAAFAVVAGLETQIRNTYGRAVDLSEQQLFAKAKGDWFPTVGAFGDGLPVSGVLQNLAAGALALRTETTWGYNAASSRVEIAAPPTGVYQNSCDGYGQACSDTNHEYGISCTTIGTVKYCARIDPTAGSTGENYRLLAWTNLWRSAPQLTTLAIRASLAAGQPVAIGVDVTYCLEKSSMWHQLDDGSWEQLVYRSYLSTDRYGCDPETSTGSHALLAVGYVSDAQMAARWTLPAGINVGEGGYYVIRNSWGCGSGDGGYLYISDRYLQQILHSAATVGPVAAAYGSVSLQYQTSVPVGSDGIIRTPATVTLKANANSLIKRVAFYQQGPLVVTQLGSSVDGNGTITHDLQLGAANSGDRVYFARGWDADNNLVSSNTVVVRVRIPGAPTVSLSASPSPISEGQTLTLTAAAASADGSGITQVQFMKGFTQLATVTAPPYATTVTLPRGETGNVGFAAVATNGNGFATTSAPLIVSVKSSAKPKIDAFTVSPTVIGAPQVVTLAWTVSGADTLTLTGNPGNTLDVTGKSSQQLYQTQAATFTLTASNAAGSTSASVSVAYVPLPSIASFTATPSTTAAGGGTVTLAWSASDATTLSLDHGVGDVTGSASKAVAVTTSTTYTLTASNASGSTTRQVTVTVPATPPPQPSIGAFSATPASLAYPGGTSTLAWTVSGATTLAIDHGVGDVSGSTSVPASVATTTTYTLTASSASGTSTAQVTVVVGAAPPPPPPPSITSFTATPNSLPAGGGSATLAWNVNGADSIAIDQGVGTVTGSSRSVAVTTTTSFTLTASNSGGSATAQVTVSVAGSALDRYVDAVNGSDANAGTAGAPYRTIGKALAQTASGATAWLFNGSYTGVAEGLSGNAGLTVPDGRTLAGVNSGAAVIGFGLTMAGSGNLNGLVIDPAVANGSAIVANGGTVGLSRIAVRNSGFCDAAISVGGGAVVTLDSGGDASHSYAGAGVHGFARVFGGGSLTIVGGRIEGAGQLQCTGRGVLTVQSLGSLRLDGVAIVGSDFRTPSGGGSNAVVAADDSAKLTLVGAVIDGALVPDGANSVGLDLRFGTAASVLSMSGSSISRMAGRGAAVSAGLGALTIATSTFAANGIGIDNGGNGLRLTVSDSLFDGNAYGGIDLIGGSTIVVSGSTFTGNWTSAGPPNTDPTASAIALRSEGSLTFTLRNTSIRGNGNASVARPAVYLSGADGSNFDLGKGADPGGNTIAENANVNLWIFPDYNVLVRAAGNTWTPLVQDADALGRYVIPSTGCGASPCDKTSGDGPNYKVSRGTLRLVE